MWMWVNITQIKDEITEQILGRIWRPACDSRLGVRSSYEIIYTNHLSHKHHPAHTTTTTATRSALAKSKLDFHAYCTHSEAPLGHKRLLYFRFYKKKILADLRNGQIALHQITMVIYWQKIKDRQSRRKINWSQIFAKYFQKNFNCQHDKAIFSNEIVTHIPTIK